MQQKQKKRHTPAFISTGRTGEGERHPFEISLENKCFNYIPKFAQDRVEQLTLLTL